MSLALLCPLGMTPSPPGAAWLPLAGYKGSPASVCPTSASVSEAKLLHPCPSSCLLEMSVTVNPQYPVTGKILGAHTVQQEEEADVGVFVDL